ncbi:MAG: Gfo/Idh/MocA family oxidoreductase [Chloroflexi bacterium]|nr:Gfo/Idh/MocA family oxidoreductase [Chloroflexota bacterium]
MAEKVRIGIIGVGQIGKRHVQLYREIPDAELVAVADLREDEAQRVAAENGIPSVYTDYRELLKRDDITSVDVCLHNRLHMPITVDALRAGKNVYCEKPMSWTYSEARTMYDTAQAERRMLHIQLNTLYERDTRGAKRLLDEGHLGELYYAKSSNYRRRGRPFVDGYGTRAFVNMDTSGGGALIDMGVYHIARMLFLLGSPEVLSVSASTYQKLENIYPDRRQESGYDVEELAVAFVRLAGSVTYVMEEAWAIQADKGQGDYVFGSRGGLRVSPLAYFATVADMEMDATFDVERADWRWHQCNPMTEAYSSSQRHWVAAQLGRVPLLDTAGLALKTALISEGVYISSHLRREVTAEEIKSAPPGLGRL